MAAKKEAPAPAEPGTALAVPSSAATGLVERTPEEQRALNLMAADAGEGLDDFSRDDLAIPFLRVLQKGSPEVNKQDPKYVEGAEAGDFINTVTRVVRKGQVTVVPVQFSPSYMEWRPRKKGGGIVKDWGADDSALATCKKDPETGRDITPEGNEFVRSAMYYVFVVDPETGAYERAVLSLSGTQLKKSKRWNTLMQSQTVKHPETGVPFRPASFYFSYNINTVFEKNEKGDWMGVNVSVGKPVIDLPYGSGTYLAAREFRANVTDGKVTVKHEVEDVVIEEVNEDLPF